MGFILYTPHNPQHRTLNVNWRCLNENCGHEFYASLSDTKDNWAWCPKCNASSRMICEAA